MKNVIFLCDSYVYNASPNGICIESIAEYMCRNGFRVNVVTFFNNVGQQKYENINGVNIYRADPGMIWRKLYENQAASTSAQRRRYAIVNRLSALNGLLHAFRYPLLSTKQVRNMAKCARQAISGEVPNYIICVYHKMSDVLAGIRLKKKYPSAKLILYTLDAISGGWIPNILHSRKIPYNSLKRWEKYFFSNIDMMFAMEAHRSYYETDEYQPYKSLIEYLDIPLLNVSPQKIDRKTDKMHFVFTGSMCKDTANPYYFLQLLEHLPYVVFDIYGMVSRDISDEIENHPLYNSRLFMHGKVEHDKVMDIQKRADVLVNFGNANPNMIPCKIFEYMSTCHKIISFTHAETDSSLPYIQKYPLGLIVEEDEEKTKEQAQCIENFLKDSANLADPAQVEKMFIKNTPAYFVDRIRAL